MTAFGIIVMMRISTRWSWIPLAITVAGVVYLSMVRIASFGAAQRAAESQTPVIREAPRSFIPPPAATTHSPAAMQEPPDLSLQPVRPSSPALPVIQLPPFRGTHK